MSSSSATDPLPSRLNVHSPLRSFHMVDTPKSAQSSVPSHEFSPVNGQTMPRQSVSPMNHRHTPLSSKSSPRCPQRSPSKPSLQSVNSVSFTPQRTKQLPRAWERRPATPYVPRDDKQKIWKRVPLGELGVDANRPVHVTRREREARKDYARIVKKLKTDHDDENKENAFVAVNSKEQCGNWIPKKPFRTDFVSMRMEDDQIRGSPKKKIRQSPESDENVDCGRDSVWEDEREDENLDQDELVEANELNDSPLDNQFLQSGDAAQEDASPKHQTLSQEEHTEELLDFETVEDKEQRGTEHILPASDETQLINRSTSVIEIPDVITITEVTTSGARELISQEGPNLSQPVENIETPQCNIEQLECDDAHAADEAPEDNRSSSPPTLFAENIIVDELAVKESPKPVKPESTFKREPIDQAISSKREDERPFIKQETVPRRISDDETAFLRDFMSRTKAERAAREQALQTVFQDDITIDQEAEHTKVEQTCESFQTFVSPLKLAPTSVEQDDTTLTSPLRRSKRAAVTTTPRSLPVPNSIQLKRANGNEFIFTANKTSSVANIAMSTRSNTKKNKGSAINVHARLEELLVERAKEEAEEIKPANETEKVSPQTLDDKTSKKRKRDRNETSSRQKKVLRWNDENLVSYQEAERGAFHDSDEIEDSSQDSTHRMENTESVQQIKLTLTLTTKDRANNVQFEGNPLGGDLLATEALPDKLSQTKVRKARRGIAGTVNGTPAPKTRSKKLFDMDESTMDVQLEEGTMLENSIAVSAAAATLAIDEVKNSQTTSTVSRKSRMPVPSSARRGPAASASIRTAAASTLPTRVPTSGREDQEGRLSAREKVKKDQGQKDADTTDMLGRRRLRVRS